jgi:hypothetical protein
VRRVVPNFILLSSQSIAMNMTSDSPAEEKRFLVDFNGLHMVDAMSLLQRPANHRRPDKHMRPAYSCF